MLKIIIILGTLTSFGFSINLTQYFQNDYIVKPERFEIVDYNERYMSNVTYKNFKYNRTNFGMNCSGTFKIDIHGPIIVKAQAYKFQSNEYRLFPISFPFDLCDILEQNIFELQNIYDCGNWPRCPFKKGHYTICNWSPDYSKFPPYVPRGRYMLNLEWSNLGIMFIKYNWYTEVIDVPLKY